MAFTKENQPETRGRKKGSLTNPSLKLVKAATPEIIKVLIDRALSGDAQAADVLLKRALPELDFNSSVELAAANLEFIQEKTKELLAYDSRINTLENAINKLLYSPHK